MLFELAAETHTALGKVLAWAYAKVRTLRGLQNCTLSPATGEISLRSLCSFTTGWSKH
jgi:hypothetical protein